jgi:hypothetical protein
MIRSVQRDCSRKERQAVDLRTLLKKEGEAYEFSIPGLSFRLYFLPITFEPISRFL